MENKEKFRSSILSVLDNTLRLTWIATLLVITNFAIIVKKVNELNLNIDINLVLIILLLVFIAAVFVYYFVIYHIYRYSIQDNIITVHKNLLVKDRKQIVTDNIANVCLSKNLFERVFKLTRVRIYENARNKSLCDFEVVVNQNNLQKYIIPMLEKCNISFSKTDMKYIINFSVFDILRHSFFNISISSIIIIINFILLLFNMINDGSLVKEILYNSLGLIVTLIGFVFPVIYSILKNTLKYINFNITKKNEYIYLSYGLFTLKRYIIPTDKINGIIADVSFLSKIFRCYKLNIINAGIGDKKSKIEMLIPISKKVKCEKVLNFLLPEYTLKVKYRSQPLESIIILFFKIVVIMLILVIPAIYIDVKLASIISLVLLLAIFLIYFIKRIIISDKYICIINGLFIKRIRIIKYNKIENIEIRDGIISKKFGLCKVYMCILSDIKNTRLSSGYITQNDMYKIAGKVLN